MDGLDELLSELKHGPSPCTRDRKAERAVSRGGKPDHDDWEDWGEEDCGPVDDAVDGTQEGADKEVARVEKGLKSFLTDLVDASVSLEAEEYLNDIPFQRFMEYYLVTPSLAEYTIQSELNRMDYTVCYEGAVTSNKQLILSMYERTKMKDIWRLANQSIYADSVFAVTELYLPGDLTVTIHSSHSRFQVDLDESSLRATGTFNFSAPYNLRGDKRHFGSIVIHVLVDLHKKSVRHVVETPVVEVIFDSDLHEVAKCAAILLGDQQSETKYKWFSKIGSIVDARTQLVSHQLLSKTGLN